MGTAQGAAGAEVPPEWARDAGWRKTVKQLLEKTEGLNNSQRKCAKRVGGTALIYAKARVHVLAASPPCGLLAACVATKFE